MLKLRSSFHPEIAGARVGDVVGEGFLSSSHSVRDLLQVLDMGENFMKLIWQGREERMSPTLSEILYQSQECC